MLGRAKQASRRRHAGVNEALPMNDFQLIADRVGIEALRSEFADAPMMRD